MTGEAPDPKIYKGTFKMRQIGEFWSNGFGVTCFEGLRMHPGELGEEVVFKRK